MALSADGTTLLSGGGDGHVRKYDVYASMNGKTLLTQNVRHPFVDGVLRAGVLSAWWANEEIPQVKGEEEEEEEHLVSPVHSLAIQQESLWGLSGTESGNINLCSLRHEPGQLRHVLRKHTSAVSAMVLTNDDTELISGGWDRSVHQWDLNTGQVVRSFPGHAGQISSLSLRPLQLGQSMAGIEARSPYISVLASAVPGSPSRKISMERSQSGQSVNTPLARGAISATTSPVKNKSPLKQQIAALNATQISTEADEKAEAEGPARAESIAAASSTRPTPYTTPYEPHAPTPAKEASITTPATPSKQSKDTTVDSLFGGEDIVDDMELERDLNEALGLGEGHSGQGKAGDGMVGMDDGEELKGPDRPSALAETTAEKEKDADSDGDSLFGADSADAEADIDAEGELDAEGEDDVDAEGEDEDADGEDDDAPLAARFTSKTPTSGLELPGGGGAGNVETPALAAPSLHGKEVKAERKSALPKPAYGGLGIAAGFNADVSKFSNDILLTSTLGGQVTLWDKRVPSYTTDGRSYNGVRSLTLPEKTPPWCMAACWSSRGDKIYVGRRNETVDEWDLRMIPDAGDATTAHQNESYSGTKGNARFARSLRFPTGSGPVTAIAAMPNNRHIVCGSFDNVRIWDTQAIEKQVPFRIVAGHHGATVSQIIIDPTCRFLFTSSGDRGWLSTSTEALLLHEIQVL